MKLFGSTNQHLLKKLLPLLIGGNFLFIFLLSSCLGDEDYSLSMSDKLSFSADTIAFDTVISGQATNTYTFQVYNRNKKALRIPQVYLERGGESPFKVNVDGTFLENGTATDFEIAGKDSIRVFLFVKVEESNQDVPVEASDKLVFVTEAGLRQEVVLSAFGQDVVPLKGQLIEQDVTLDSQRPYQIFDSLVVAEGCTLTIGAGVRLYFHPDAKLVVHGTLDVQGTLGNPVQMRGDRLGNMFSNQPYDRIPGQWGGVVFTGSSYGNRINYCDIHSAQTGIRCDSSDVEKEKLRLENSIVHNMSGDCIYARMSHIFVGNSQITNAGGNCLTLYGGDNTFVHCTIGNFYVFSGGRGVALDFANEDGDIRLPLYNAAFMNCIITGYSSDEIMGRQSERYKEDPFDYSFLNCLLNTPEYEDEKVQNCLWDDGESEVNRDKNFVPEFDLDKLIFAFGLNPKSQAVGTADIEVSRTYYPVDMKGRDRLQGSGADMGCYEADTEEGK